MFEDQKQNPSLEQRAPIESITEYSRKKKRQNLERESETEMQQCFLVLFSAQNPFLSNSLNLKTWQELEARLLFKLVESEWRWEYSKQAMM